MSLILSTHAGRLERWLGADKVEQMSESMRDWYGPPIAVAGVPGSVWAHAGGDFKGPIASGQFGSAIDYAQDRLMRILKGWPIRQRATLNMAGFSSLSDLIAEATAGKGRQFAFQKNGPTGVVNVTSSLWGLGSMPIAGASASAAPGGDALTSLSVGAFPYTNPSSSNGDTQHFVKGEALASVAGNTLLLYDRLFQVNKTMASTTTETVTGVPTRYQSSNSSDPDYIGGNFLFVEVVGTALPATGHNWTVCVYTNQAGTSQALPSLTGNASAIVRRLDHPAGQWFAPLVSGDVGVKNILGMQCSASVASGLINFVLGHPIAFMPCPAANLGCITDGIMTAFNLVRIFDNACLAFLEPTKPAVTATNYTGSFMTVAG